MARETRWLRLDNAAKLYPSARRTDWSNVYRLSVELSEAVDRPALEEALRRILPRFPSIAAKLGFGLFWYYLEPIDNPPELLGERAYPCSCMSRPETRRCAFRVFCYQNRITVEFFHALCDGNGGLIFLKTLVATYLEVRYGISVPHTDGVLDLTEAPSADELEDSFLRAAGKVARPRKEQAAYRLTGSKEPDGYVHVITGEIDVAKLHEVARSRGVSITTYLAAVMFWSIAQIQCQQQPFAAMRRPIKVLIPVNLRPFFGSRTLRNFVLYVTPIIEQKLGDYSFDEILKSVHHQMGNEITQKKMRARITTNVRSEKNPILKVLPLFIKNFGMKLVYRMVGERASCITVSNLGNVTLPEVMRPYVERFDFTLGVQSTLPCNCGVISYNGKMHITFTRNIREATLERNFFTFLRKEGIISRIETNHRSHERA